MAKKLYQAERFHYSLWLETTDWFFSGKKKSHGMASAFSSYRYTKERLRSISRKLRRRISDVVTSDEDLKGCLICDLNSLDAMITEMHPKNHNDQDIIGKLFEIIGTLLGWGWDIEGKFVRTPIYFQTAQERELVLRRRAKIRMPEGLWECYHRRQLVLQMRAEEKSYAQIALLLNATETSIKQIESAQHIVGFYSDALERIEVPRQ